MQTLETRNPFKTSKYARIILYRYNDPVLFAADWISEKYSRIRGTPGRHSRRESEKCVLDKNHMRRIPPSDSSENYLTKSTRNGTTSSGTRGKKKYLSCRL